MKKMLPVLLLLLLLCCAVTLSRAEETAPESETLLDRALRVAEDSDDLVWMDQEDLYETIGIRPEDYTDFAYLADYDALSGRELVLLRAADEDAAERVCSLLEQYLENRMLSTRNYLPEAFRSFSEAEIVQEDLLVVLSVAPADPGEISLLLQEE